MSYNKTVCVSPRCLCVSNDAKSWAKALRVVVQPSEVANDAWYIQQQARAGGYHIVEYVSFWLKLILSAEVLRYIPDPHDCELVCSPAGTKERGGGDCDDLASLVASVLLALGVGVDIVLGLSCSGPRQCGGHMWLEGVDEVGFFLLEPTTGAFYRVRPATYVVKVRYTMRRAA